MEKSENTFFLDMKYVFFWTFIFIHHIPLQILLRYIIFARLSFLNFVLPVNINLIGYFLLHHPCDLISHVFLILKIAIHINNAPCLFFKKNKYVSFFLLYF